VATIAFANVLLENPSLENVLDSTPSVGTANANTFEIINNEAGATNGFIFRLTGAGFTFGGLGGAPNGGTITGFTVLNGAAQVIATGIPGATVFSNAALANFWSILTTSGPFTALNNLLGNSDVINGTDNVDHLETHSSSSFVDPMTGKPFPDTVSGGGGNDVITSRTSASNEASTNHILIGGTGDDIFRVDMFDTGADLAVHGNAQVGSGGDTDNDLLQVIGEANFAVITDIDRLSLTPPAAVGQATFLTGHVGPGLLSPTLEVIGGSNSSSLTVRLERSGTGAVDLNLSGWTFSNWGGEVRVDLEDGIAANDHVIGSFSRDIINGGLGGDNLDGGGGTDSLNGGAGDDVLISAATATGGTLDGGDDADFAHIDRSNRTLSFALDIADPNVASSLGDGTSIIHVERVEFHAGSGNDHLTGGALADLLFGNAGADFLGGGGGNDDLRGGNGVDTLAGDAGNDELDGGAGNDNFDGGDGDDTMVGSVGIDTLDGGEGTDSAVFSGVRSAYTITPFGDAFQVAGPDGLDFLTNIELAVFDDITVPLAGGGGNSPFAIPVAEILWRHSDGSVVEGNHNLGDVPTTWQIVGTGDFDHDGDSDILWRHADGAVVTWELENGAFVVNHNLPSAATTWRIAATGDF
jgi:Ca2+-binding RTX toxin-like protein